MNNKPNLLSIAIFGVVLVCASCSPVKRLAIQRDITSIVNKSPIFQDELLGLSVYDPYLEQYLVDINADKYFTPASNTKLLTLYASELTLPDSIPTFAYRITGDSLILQPLGDPTFLHPDFQSQKTLERIRQFRVNKVLVRFPEFQLPPYGPGWSWDDFGYSFQPERAHMPLYGNVVSVEQTSETKVTPAFFEDFVDLTQEKPDFRRDRNQNLFRFSLKEQDQDTLVQSSPFVNSPELMLRLLSDTLGIEVQPTSMTIDFQDTLFNGPSLPMKSIMMLRSDNFLAEQMLYMAAIQRGSENMEVFIESMVSTDMNFTPDPLIWVDGSGLSRYNMFTPRSLTSLIHRIYRQMDWSEVEAIFPTGGVNGTIRNWYGAELPYVYAKTGTLRHNHCLSGFIKTKSGKTLIFSFMNNHFTRPGSEIKQEMQTLLEKIRDSY